MTKRSVLYLLLVPVFLLALLYAVSFVLFLYRPVVPPSPVVVTVPSGAPFQEVARSLEAAGVVADAGRFKLLAHLRGDARRTQAGEYGFTLPATPGTVLDRLVAGDVQRHRFTIPEGLTLRDIADRLETEGLGTAGEIVRTAEDPEFLASLEIKASSLEGYLFPETYYFARGLPPRALLRAMVHQFREHLTPDLLTAAAEQEMNLHQLVTLASIIQKEAGNQTEMPLISAVFHNRLRRRIPLQADPTVIYGIENFNGNLTRHDLVTRTPYNTYRIPGLPPGPIANPGQEALRAAAFPAAVDYLFFVSRGDGSHQFSSNLKDHNKAVRRFQLHRR